MKRIALVCVSFAMFSGAALAQSSRDSDRRSDRYGDTPQFVEPSYEPRRRGGGQRPGDPNPYGTTPGAPNQYGSTPGASSNQWGTTPGASSNQWGNTPGAPNQWGSTPGAPNQWATTPGAPPNSQPLHPPRGQDYPGSASRGSNARAVNPNGANLLPEDRRYGTGDGGGRPRR